MTNSQLHLREIADKKTAYNKGCLYCIDLILIEETHPQGIED